MASTKHSTPHNHVSNDVEHLQVVETLYYCNLLCEEKCSTSLLMAMSLTFTSH